MLLLLFIVVGVVEGGLRLGVAWSERLVVEAFDNADGVVCGFVLEMLDFHAVDGFEEVVVDFPPEFCREGVQSWFGFGFWFCFWFLRALFWRIFLFLWLMESAFSIWIVDAG